MIINNISVLLGKNRLTIAETAKIANVKYSTVKNLYYDKTKSIDFETMNKLCFALDCKPGDLFTYLPD